MSRDASVVVGAGVRVGESGFVADVVLFRFGGGAMRALDVAELAGITYRQLDYWTRQGYVTPMDAATPGSGNSRDYSPVEARVAEHMAALVREGVYPEAAAVMARKIAKAGFVTAGPFVIVAKAGAR